MKYFLPLIILIFAFTAFGQIDEKALKAKTKSFKKSRQYVIKYDKFKDRTVMQFWGPVISGTGSYMWSGTMIQLITAFSFEGKTLDKNIESFGLVFSATGKEWKFLKDQHLYILADEERMDLGEGERDSDITKPLLGGIGTAELLGFKLTRAELEKLANAKKIELKVSNREFVLKPENQENFKNVLALGSVK